MTKKEVAIIAKMESDAWTDLQRQYYIESLNYNPNDFKNGVEFQSKVNTPAIQRARAAWAALDDVVRELGINAKGSEDAWNYYQNVLNYFGK